jgi:aspartyl-tRNA(Asn)/glutamyl-tRNA(Gln) amidotransferase subunit B
MELVTEPCIRDVKQIGDFGRELQLLLRYLGVSDADMEKGQMRVEVNLSLGTIVDGELKFGTKVEVKNIASFNMAERAAQYEIERQRTILESGGMVEQETRGWNDPQQKTVSQRKKESSHDYRYFPEPDIPPVDLSRFDFKAIRLSLPELPSVKRVRLVGEYGLTPEQVEVLVFDRPVAEYFEGVVSEMKEELRETFSPAYSQVSRAGQYPPTEEPKIPTLIENRYRKKNGAGSRGGCSGCGQFGSSGPFIQNRSVNSNGGRAQK